MAQRTVVPALLVDLYELTMGQSYLDEGMAQAPATFSLFARHLPTNWGYFQAAHGRQLVDFGLQRTHGSDAALKVARSTYLVGFESA